MPEHIKKVACNLQATFLLGKITIRLKDPFFQKS